MTQTTAATDSLGARAARGSLWLGLVNFASKGSQMAVTIVLALFLTEADLGLVTVAVSLVNIGQVIQTMGVYDVIARTRGDEKAMAGTVLVMSVSVGLVMAVGGVALCVPIAQLVGAPGSAPLIAIVAVGLPFTAVGGVQMALMHRELDFRRRMAPDAGSALLGAVVTIALALAGAGPYSLAVGMLVTAILQPLFGYAVGSRVRLRWDTAVAGEALGWIKVVGPAAVVSYVLISIDYPIISRILGPDAVGVYSLAFRIAWVPYIMVAVVLGAVAFPVFTTLVRANRRHELGAAAGRFTHASLLIVGGLYVIAALMADSIALLGEHWAAAAPVLVVLCGYGVIISVLVIWYEVLRAADWLRVYLLLEISHLVIATTLLITLTGRGVVAAAWAQLIAASVLLVPTYLVMRRAGVAPGLIAVGRAVLGLSIPVLGCVAAASGLRAVGLGRTVSWADAVVEVIVLVAVFSFLTWAANRTVLGDLRGLRRGDSYREGVNR
ncbi:oligosaccharide flippase family protein [Dietzia sp. ANT_WB102]|uniref:oligosaccharide flippase family protein n=1 Tax=Dietzia sp. ANT_WB102 TaxID=2597345 RepID=UPI0011EEDD48|nr:oligosaccharide flippase family protein [Dietzia sp. ANT_WB102]KAA0919367.1 oligosaccharide flippase family protein [Dietzia sp. ANT_WB102]